ncbi:MAG: hypothetical protein ACE5E9_13860 [Nitrospinaceae bacterium]
MISLLIKRKFRLFSGWLVALALPALVFPLFHIHGSDQHRHPGQLFLHVHKAHFHSEFWEAYAHLIHAHSSDPEQDKRFHHSHSSPQHDRDEIDFYTFQKDVPPVKAAFVSKSLDAQVRIEISRSLIGIPAASAVLAFEPRNRPGTLSSRSPPFLII